MDGLALGERHHIRAHLHGLAPPADKMHLDAPVLTVPHRAMVERHLHLARRVADQVDAAPDLERLADVRLNVVCFRYHPPDVPEAELNDINRRLGELILEDGRVYFGTTDYAGKVAFRPAMVNWRTREEDVDLIVRVVRELGSRSVARDPRA